MRAAAALLLVLLLPGCAAPGSLPPAASPTTPPTASAAPAIRLEPWMDGFEKPVLVAHDREGVAHVVEQVGRITAIRNGTREVWLDIEEEVSQGEEQGLLGLAFEPARECGPSGSPARACGANSSRAYVSYTNTAGDSVLERYHTNGTREIILTVDQPYANHNGGHLLFGPDGYLYYGLGDGGSAGDPQGNGQDPKARLGSILRLDVSGESGYAPAPGNPWGDAWAKGLRNPWRFSFDRETGDFWLADVGQNEVEEIDVLRAPVQPGANFGWNTFEGTRRYALVGGTFSPHTPPVAEYTHEDGCSVTGGFVYRGAAHPALDGLYFFADYCSGKVWALREKENWRMVEMLDTEVRVSSFAEDPQGELYVIGHDGDIYKLAATGEPLLEILRP